MSPARSRHCKAERIHDVTGKPGRRRSEEAESGELPVSRHCLTYERWEGDGALVRSRPSFSVCEKMAFLFMFPLKGSRGEMIPIVSRLLEGGWGCPPRLILRSGKGLAAGIFIGSLPDFLLLALWRLGTVSAVPFYLEQIKLKS